MNAPYLLIPIGLILLILYGISYLFNRLEILSKSVHRKIWNYSLLVTFLTAGCLGILMAIQINYKLEVPWTEKVLKWHVNFGIGMSMVGMFHLLWHWRYYLPVKSPRRKSNSSQISFLSRLGSGSWPFLTGFISIAVQTLMIRELLGLFQGNELMLSLIMFLWLLITGLGAIAGNRGKSGIQEENQLNQKKSFILVLTQFLLPLVLLPLMYYCKSIFFAPGIEAGPIAFSGFCLLVLTPFCFLTGFSITFTTRLFASSGLNIRRAYAWESIGGISSGILCSIAILTGTLTPPASRWSQKLFHPNDEIIASRSGPAGRLTITQNGDQINIFENGLLTQSSGNTLIIEEMTHFAMIQHPDPRNILVIGGLLSGINQELLKYPLTRLDLAEPDNQIFRLAKRLHLLPPPAPSTRFIDKNLNSWINHPDIQYDIILVMLPGPQNLSLNRFYTAEFFTQIKNILTPDGFVSVMLPGTANYLSKEAIAAISPVINSIRSSFRFAQIFPGENNYLIAGNTDLKTDILSELKLKKINTLYLSKGYFDESLFQTRLSQANLLMKPWMAKNTILKPIAYFAQINWWLGQFPGRLSWLLTGILIILIFFSFFKGGTSGSAMFILGASASGIEIILLLMVQMISGSLFLFTGLFAAIFMAGLAFGSLKNFSGYTGKVAGSGTIILISFSMITALLAGMVFWMTLSGQYILVKTLVIALISFMSAFLPGLYFTYLTRINFSTNDQGNIYIYDMLGAAFGALAYPMVIIPMLGILPALGIISGSGLLILIIQKALRK